MSAPLGGSMAAALAGADMALDGWIAHAKQLDPNTPELMTMLLLSAEDLDVKGKVALFTSMLATAIVRLAQDG